MPWLPGSAGTRTGEGIGSLLLGLYNDGDRLHHVGVAASFTKKRRAELVDELTAADRRCA